MLKEMGERAQGLALLLQSPFHPSPFAEQLAREELMEILTTFENIPSQEFHVPLDEEDMDDDNEQEGDVEEDMEEKMQ